MFLSSVTLNAAGTCPYVLLWIYCVAPQVQCVRKYTSQSQLVLRSFTFSEGVPLSSLWTPDLTPQFICSNVLIRIYKHFLEISMQIVAWCAKAFSRKQSVVSNSGLSFGSRLTFSWLGWVLVSSGDFSALQLLDPKLIRIYIFLHSSSFNHISVINFSLRTENQKLFSQICI